MGMAVLIYLHSHLKPFLVEAMSRRVAWERLALA